MARMWHKPGVKLFGSLADSIEEQQKYIESVEDEEGHRVHMTYDNTQY
jgi:hypothetical protein